MEWGLLILPSLVSRFLIRKRPSFIGVLQDLFVTFQLSCFPSFLIPIFQLLILYDGWIERKLRFRLRPYSCGIYSSAKRV